MIWHKMTSKKPDGAIISKYVPIFTTAVCFLVVFLHSNISVLKDYYFLGCRRFFEILVLFANTFFEVEAGSYVLQICGAHVYENDIACVHREFCCARTKLLKVSKFSAFICFTHFSCFKMNIYFPVGMIRRSLFLVRSFPEMPEWQKI